jgi:peptide-methionine (R)-S-oxide reductase
MKYGFIAMGIAATAVGLSVLGASPGADAQVISRADKEKIMGWKIVDGRFAEGPYRGYWAESPKRKDKITLTDEEWKKRLTDEQYKILRSKGTEPPFCSVFQDTKGNGVFKVVGTGQKVFKSNAKFDSGTGWPSFFEPYDKDAVWLKLDTSHGMIRMEVLATQCDGHLGHVFEDGPRDKSGLRFCINSKVLEFEADKE